MEPFTAPIRRCGLIVAACLTALFSVFLSTEVVAEGKTIIVLDGSGSMWGEVPGGVKIDIAKQTVTDLMTGVDPNLEIGLMSYGHRRKGDCEDIELLAEPAANNREAMLDAVKNLIPKGKTPLCDAVMQAAELLRYEEEKASVILVSDGIETCGKDPAAVGDFLAAHGIDFVCHVIAFDIDRDKNAGLDALSGKTGGKYLEAKDAAGLRTALNEAVEMVTKKESVLLVSGTNGDGELLSGVSFEIYSGKESEEPLHQGMGGKYRASLEPGNYHVVGVFGESRAQADIEVPAGETVSTELVFEASGLKASALMNTDGERIEEGLSWRVFDAEKGEDTDPVAYSYEAQPVFQLSPGNYRVTAKYEESKAEKSVEVPDSGAAEVELVFGSGTLAAQARMSEDSPPLERDLAWKLYHAEADAEGDLRQAAYSYEAKTNLVVPSGKYILEVRHKQSASRKEVEVLAGETTEAVLTFGSGTLVATAKMSEDGAPVSGGLAWKLFSAPDAEGNRAQAGYGYSDTQEFKVPSGAYLLELKRGSANVSEEVVVSAGETTEMTLNLNAGKWKGVAKMAAERDPVTADTAWKVFGPADAEGNQPTVAYSYGNAEYVLPAGTFTAHLKRGSAETTREITVLPGKTTEDTLVLEAGKVTVKGIAGVSGPAIRILGPADSETSNENYGYAYSIEKSFYLPAGSYRFQFKYDKDGEKEVLEKAFSVKSGEFITVEIQ